MYARVLKMQLNPGRVEEASTLFRESIVPSCQKQKGYRGGYFLADRKTGDCSPITLWDSEEDMLANEESLFFQEQLGKYLSFFKTPPVRDAYEVLVEDRG